MVTIAMVPGRIGSTRLKMKNLALLNGRPLMSYAIEAARASGAFDRVVVNGDREVFEQLAARYGAEFYLRPADLGTSTTTSDRVVYDFVQQHPADVVAWVNPTSPLQSGEEIRSVAAFFHAQRLDSLITVREEYLHGLVGGRPVNFDPDTPFAQTQDLPPVQLFVYSVMMWRTATFMRAFEAHGYALLSGKVGFFPVSKRTALIIKTSEDLQIAEALLQGTGRHAPAAVRYDPCAQGVPHEAAR